MLSECLCITCLGMSSVASFKAQQKRLHVISTQKNSDKNKTVRLLHSNDAFPQNDVALSRCVRIALYLSTFFSPFASFGLGVDEFMRS